MGEIEKRHKDKQRRVDLQELILETISVAGVLSVGMVAPNVLRAMEKAGLLPKSRRREYISSSASKLRKKGLIKFDGKGYSLTKQGETRLVLWKRSNFKLNKPSKWDGKWRMFIFDIPEKKRKVRDQVRYYFNQAGFYLLQDSVWVYPYDCEDVLTLLKTDLGIGKYLLYLIVDELESDKKLREHFDLLQ